jgi:cation:H+ antiporter
MQIDFQLTGNVGSPGRLEREVLRFVRRAIQHCNRQRPEFGVDECTTEFTLWTSEYLAVQFETRIDWWEILCAVEYPTHDHIDCSIHNVALVIVVAGSFLAKYADQLGEMTGLGRSMAGILLLAAATSLPELAVGCQAGLIGAADLAVGDLLGSSLFNLLILAVLDLTTHTAGKMLTRTTAAHALSVTAGMMLTAIVLFFLLINCPFSIKLPLTTGRLGFGSVAVLAGYLMVMRLIYLDQLVGRLGILEEKPQTELSLRHVIAGFLAGTAVIFFAARYLTKTADELAKESELGGTFVGTVFVALVTSLPEISTTLAAVRMKAYDLAVGNILGSNDFNMAALIGIDLFYSQPLLSSVSATHAVTAVAVIIVTAVLIMGLLYRAEKRHWIIEPDAGLVILLVVAAFVVVYWFGK